MIKLLLTWLKFNSFCEILRIFPSFVLATNFKIFPFHKIARILNVYMSIMGGIFIILALSVSEVVIVSSLLKVGCCTITSTNRNLKNAT